MSEELCSVCGHQYDSHGSHSWCENKPCDCEQIPIVDELQRKLDIAVEALAHAIVLLDSGYAVMTVPDTKIYLLEKLAEIEREEKK